MNKTAQKGFTVVEALIILLILVLTGGAGWYVYQKNHKTEQSTASNTTTNKNAEQTAQADSYAGWVTYESNYEKLSFKYPSDWKLEKSDAGIVAGDDAATLTSPSGSLQISWVSAIDGIGGACEPTDGPPTEVGPCPYWYVIDSQKLKGADLYYVSGTTTIDGTHYVPWCALQGSSGILETGSNIGYKTFKAKNSKYLVRFKCNSDSYASLSDYPEQTKDQAEALLSSDDFKQAKLILLSATY